MADGLSLGALGLAAAAGAASFLSPCVLPLLPGYLSFVSGVSFEQLGGVSRRVVTSTLAFIAGFAVMFTLAGAGAGWVGAAILGNRRALQTAAGILLILMGIAVAGLFKPAWLQRERRLLPFRPPSGPVGAALAGVAFAVGWTPCVGPILASILTLAASGSDPMGGALLLFVYSLGLGVPFLLTGLFFTRAMHAFSWFKKHFRVVQLASGALLIAYGALLLTGRFTWLSAQLSRYRLFDF